MRVLNWKFELNSFQKNFILFFFFNFDFFIFLFPWCDFDFFSRNGKKKGNKKKYFFFWSWLSQLTLLGWLSNLAVFLCGGRILAPHSSYLSFLFFYASSPSLPPLTLFTFFHLIFLLHFTISSKNKK